MAYVALYREWRPKTFNDLVGQHHVSQTLRNALATGRIAHAYLFCGPRGTGKTSTAKVLAKALNCRQGPTPEPCNECVSCQRINQGVSLDVLEIDAASNRGIDEIRDLREKVKLAATEGGYKVYIIDEVHMLTTEAFNALLKTLEEPPGHVIFILATTEPHKIPATILSRCQRFDFRRIGFKDMAERIRYIAEREQLSITPEALDLIAKGAEGGMRDALSILDQCISYAGKEIGADDVMAVMGTVAFESLAAIARAIRDKDLLPGFQIIQEIFEQGKEIRQFIKDLVEFFRQILLVQVCREANQIIQAPEKALDQLEELGRQFSRQKILQIIESFTEAEREMKWSTQPRLLLELALIKALEDEQQGAPAALLDRIARLEERIFQGPPALPTGVLAGKKPEPVPWEPFRQEPTLPQEDLPDLETIKKRWRDFLDFFKNAKKVSLYAVLVEGEPVQADKGQLLLAFKYPFHKERVEGPENKAVVEEALKNFYGRSYRIKTCLQQDLAKGGEGPGSNSLVTEAIHLFGGEVIEIND